jgi:hypothetical protein
LFKPAKEVRLQIKNVEERILWYTLKKEKNRSQVTQEMHVKLHTWIINHPHIVNSLVSRDTMQIKDPEPGIKIRTRKNILEVLVRQELYNDLLELPA